MGGRQTAQNAGYGRSGGRLFGYLLVEALAEQVSTGGNPWSCVTLPKWECVRCASPRSGLLISWATGSRPHPAPRLLSADALLDMHDMREPATVNAKSTTQLCDM